MTRPRTALTMTAALLAALWTATATAQAPGVNGDWNVSLHGQHIIPVGMTLSQDGEKVTGTLMLWNGDVELTGTFAGDTLKIAGTLTPTDGAPAGERAITATLAADGTLAGTIAVGAMGTVKLTAERFAKRRVRPAASPSAAPSGPGAAYAGRWTLAVERGTEHLTFDLTLTATATAITGVLASDHTGALDLHEARIENGALHFAVQMPGTSEMVTFEARRAEDGTLSGSLAGPMGATPFTGTRRP